MISLGKYVIFTKFVNDYVLKLVTVLHRSDSCTKLVCHIKLNFSVHKIAETSLLHITIRSTSPVIHISGCTLQNKHQTLSKEFN